ncbi:MAG: tetratricopeptide repeat protein [Deltaproteobacteria bacterium]|nr:tetratricopeptide repeat protein [Deltaproteobacteria bacterium]
MSNVRKFKDGKRKLAAIMFTDIVGYSAMSHRDESLALELLEEHRQIVRPLLTSHDGREIKTIGDAFLVEFDSATSAVQCAIHIQTALAERNSTVDPTRAVRVRIGIHLGDVVAHENDVYGDGVNIASRLQFLAEPGGICVSRQVFDQVHNKVDRPIHQLGNRTLKNISTPVQVYRVELGHGAPSRARLAPMRRLAFAAAAVVPILALSLMLSLHKSRKGAGTFENDARRNRIAVLPFENLSTPDDEYLSDGMTEELISSLSRATAIRVIARTSVMHYKHQQGALRQGSPDKTIREIADELGVATVLEGSVRKAGDKLRVSVTLIDARTQETIWSNAYDGPFKQVLDIQRNIASKVMNEFRVRVIAGDTGQPGKLAVSSPEAYVNYLRGRFHLNQRTEEGFAKSIEHFKKAIDLDSRFAQAYVELSNAFSLMSYYGGARPAEALPRAKLLAEKALALEPDSAEALASLAESKAFFERDWTGAEAAYRRSIALNPGYSISHHWYAEFLSAMGRVDEALQQNRLARELDPLSPNINSAAGHPYLLSGDYDAAIAAYRKAISLEPKFYLAHVWLAQACLKKGRNAEARQAAETALKLAPGSSLTQSMAAATYAADGHADEARKILADLDAAARRKYVSTYDLARIHAALGERDETLSLLRKSIVEAPTQMINVRRDPAFENVRSAPEFGKIVRDFGFRN